MPSVAAGVANSLGDRLASVVSNFAHGAKPSPSLYNVVGTVATGIAPSLIIGVEVSHLDTGYAGCGNTHPMRLPTKAVSAPNHPG